MKKKKKKTPKTGNDGTMVSKMPVALHVIIKKTKKKKQNFIWMHNIHAVEQDADHQ